MEQTRMVMTDADPKVYVLDKALNYGNSGGPILSAETGHVHALCSRFQPVYVPQNHLKDANGNPLPVMIPSLYGIVSRLDNRKLLDLLGGYTVQLRNPDSWEGWCWGAKHVWGCEPVGLPDQANLVADIAENTDVLVCWGCDPETTQWAWAGQFGTRLRYWFKELGIKSIFIALI